jgi:hypothetical protein
MDKQELIERIVTAGEDDPGIQQKSWSKLSGWGVQQLQDYYSELLVKPVNEARRVLAETKAGALRARELYQVFKKSGLENVEVNQILLDQYLPGSMLSFSNFRSLVQNNDSIRTKFVWASQPFAAVTQAEQETTRQATVVREAFNGLCRTLAVAGIVDVRSSDANFSLVMGSITPPFTLDKLNSAIRTVTGLFPNSPQQISEWRRDSEAAERLQLADQISACFSKDPQTCEIERKRLLTRVATEDMRQRWDRIQEARKYNNMDVDEIKKANLLAAPPPNNTGFKPLPPEITKDAIRKAEPEKLRRWLRFYGPDNLNARLAGAA